MGMRDDVRNRAQWTYRRARYTARTEGLGALLRAGAARAGLPTAAGAPAPPAPLPDGPLGERAAAAWPASVLALSSGGPRAAELAALGVPVLLRSPADPQLHDAQQLVSVLYILGTANAPDGPTLAQARRLRQKVWLEVLPQDAGAPLPACDLVIVAAPRDLAAACEVRVVPPGALAALLAEVGA